VEDLRKSGAIKADILPGKDNAAMAKPKAKRTKKTKRKITHDEDRGATDDKSLALGERGKRSRTHLNPQLDVSASNTSSDTSTDDSSRANTDSEMVTSIFLLAAYSNDFGQDLEVNFDRPPSSNLGSLPALTLVGLLRLTSVLAQTPIKSSEAPVSGYRRLKPSVI
jgi:hypothetical protein